MVIPMKKNADPSADAAAPAPAKKKSLLPLLLLGAGGFVAYLLWKSAKEEERLERAAEKAEARALAAPPTLYPQYPPPYTYPPRWG